MLRKSTIRLVSNHFRNIVDEARKKLSLFQGTWSVAVNDACELTQQVALEPAIQYDEQSFKKLELAFRTGADGRLAEHAEKSKRVDAWLLGRIADQAQLGSGKSSVLRLNLTPFAVLKDRHD